MVDKQGLDKIDKAFRLAFLFITLSLSFAVLLAFLSPLFIVDSEYYLVNKKFE